MMKLVKCIIRAHKVDETSDALREVDVSGITVSEVAGRGRRKAAKVFWRGTEGEVRFDRHIMVDIVADDCLVEEVVRVVMQTAYTGKQGDGRIFVMTVDEAYTIRTRAWGAD